MELVLPDAFRRWTIDDLADLPDDGRRYEIVDGQLVVSPPPTFRHDEFADALCERLRAALPAGWKARTTPVLQLGSDCRVPDVGVYRQVPVARGQLGLSAEHWVLAVEVVSPTSRKTDRFFKPAEYADAGIPAYWRVELEPEPLLVVHRLAGDRYDVVQEVTGCGVVDVPVRVELDLPALLPPLSD